MFCVLLVVRKTFTAILLAIKIVDKKNLQGTMADPHICIALVIDIVISLYFWGIISPINEYGTEAGHAKL